MYRYPEDQDVIQGAAKENCIYMDASPFGFGSCALQVTVQLKNMEEARYLYDQLLPMGPILLAMTAGSPVYKGFLAGTDARWNNTCGALDDRTLEERSRKVRLTLFVMSTIQGVRLILRSHLSTTDGGSPNQDSAATRHIFRLVRA